jgi:hypothetical protein
MMNTKLHTRSPLRHVLAAALFAATALGASAQSAPPQVEVKAPPLDLRAVCPEVDAQMLKALSHAAMRQRQDGVLNVLFEVDGQRVGEVAITGSPFVYRQATRSAVRGLDCNNNGAGRQTVSMQVVFKDL